MSEQDPPLPEAVTTSAASASPLGADMAHTVNKLDRSIKVRRDVDEPLINWWLYILLVSWVTFGIYSIYLFFKRINRIDGFSERKKAYYDAVLEWTERQAAGTGQTDTVHHQLTDLKSSVAHAYDTDLRPIKAGLSFVLVLLTLGIYGFWVLHRLNRYWWDAQVLEQDFDDSLSQVWTKLGLLRYPVTFQVDQSKKRSYPLYLILTIVTFGIWGLVWDNKIHTDPDRLYRDFHSVEDSVLQIVRTA
jgi:hypothetical protein